MEVLTTAWIAATMRARGYDVVEGPVRAINAGAADSRRVRAGDLFAAYAGENTDGNLYVAEALAGGAVAAVCVRPPAQPGDATIVVTTDVIQAMAELAHAWLRASRPRVVGITGTVGKTTTKDLVAAVLSTQFRTHKSEGNLNSREGLPLAVMSLRPDHDVSVLELAMDSAGEILELCRIAEPTVGVVLNVGLTHISKLGSIEAIEAEKLSLARYLGPDGWAVMNADDPRVAAGAEGLRCQVITFGQAPGARLRATTLVDHGLAGTTFEVLLDGAAPLPVASPLPGLHTVPAALAAIGVGHALGMTIAEGVDAVSHAEGGGRMTVRKSDSGATLLDDRYNSSPASLAGALRLLKSLPGRRLALLGKMAELGEHEAEEHRLAGTLAAECCDQLFAVGDPCRVLVEAARRAGLADAHWYEDKDEAARTARRQLRAGDFLLIKASRSQAFETLIPLLEGAA